MADKNIEVNLTVKAQAEQARREMQGLGKEVESARKQFKQMEEERRRSQGGMAGLANAGRFAGGPGGMPGAGPGWSMGGMMQRMGPVGGAIAGFASLQGVQTLLSSAARSMNAAKNPLLDPTDRARGASEAVPILGGLTKTLHEFQDALQGVTTGLQKMGRDFQVDTARIDLQGGASLQKQGMQLELAQAQAAAHRHRQTPMVGMQQFDLSTLEGQRAAAAQEKMMPARLGVRGAQIDKDAADQVVRDLENRERAKASEIEKAVQEQEKRRLDYKKLTGEVGPDGSPIDRTPKPPKPMLDPGGMEAMKKALKGGDIKGFFDAGNKWDPFGIQPGVKRWQDKARGIDPDTGADVTGSGKLGRGAALTGEAKGLSRELALQNEMLDLQQQKKAALLNQGKTEVELARQKLNEDRASLSVMKDKEGRLKGQMQAFGNLTGAEQMSFNMALEKRQQGGLGALSVQEKALLQRGGGGNLVAQDIENAMGQNPMFKRAQELGLEQGNLKQLQNQQFNLEQKIVMDVQLNEKKLAEVTEQALERSLDKIVGKLEEIVSIKIRQIEVGNKIKGVLGGG